MCVDYRRLNKLQPEVTKADGGKGCISLIPLPKIDELYAKLKGFKSFFKFGSKIRILPHWFNRVSKTKIGIRHIFTRKIPIQQSTIRTSASSSILPKADQRRTSRL